MSSISTIKAKIGPREIAAQKGPFRIWDTELTGFMCQRGVTAAITHYVVFRAKDTGKQHWHKIGRHGVLTPAEARDEARKILKAVTLGDNPAGDKAALRNSCSVSELLDQYIADMQSARHNGKKASTQKSDLSRIKQHIRPALGALKVVAVTQADLVAFMNRCTPGSAKRVMQLIGAIFTFAVSRKIRPDNPAKGIVRPADRRKTRRLSEAEYKALGTALAAESSVAHDVFAFLAVSGWRASEAKLLKRSELDLDRRVANLSDSKTGASVRPLSGAAVALIARQSGAGEYVFARNGAGAPLGEIYHAWSKLGLPRDLTLHTMRHSLASLCADMGMADSTIGRLLGHKLGSITSRYIHMEKSVIEAADKAADAVLRLMAGSTNVDLELAVA